MFEPSDNQKIIDLSKAALPYGWIGPIAEIARPILKNQYSLQVAYFLTMDFEKINLMSPTIPFQGREMMNSTLIASRKVEAILRTRYTQVGREESEKIIDTALRFCAELENRRLTRSVLLAQAAALIHTAFGFEEVSVLARGADGLYRYETVIGFDEEPERELRSLSYTEKQIRDPDTSASIKIDKYLEMTIAEAEQEPEQRVGYAHPQLISMPRKDIEDFTYGDYLDIFVYGKEGICVAAFELSAPRDRKLPSACKLKGLKLFALIIGMILQRQTD